MWCTEVKSRENCILNYAGEEMCPPENSEPEKKKKRNAYSHIHVNFFDWILLIIYTVIFSFVRLNSVEIVPDIEIVSSYITETQSMTPQQAPVIRKKHFEQEETWVTPGWVKKGEEEVKGQKEGQTRLEIYTTFHLDSVKYVQQLYKQFYLIYELPIWLESKELSQFSW